LLLFWPTPSLEGVKQAIAEVTGILNQPEAVVGWPEGNSLKCLMPYPRRLKWRLPFMARGDECEFRGERWAVNGPHLPGIAASMVFENSPTLSGRALPYRGLTDAGLIAVYLAWAFGVWASVLALLHSAPLPLPPVPRRGCTQLAPAGNGLSCLLG